MNNIVKDLREFIEKAWNLIVIADHLASQIEKDGNIPKIQKIDNVKAALPADTFPESQANIAAHNDN